jgi:adenine phosphoribosyltransferase
MAAGIKLLQNVGAEVVAAAAMIELTFLHGREKLNVPVEALIQYDN